MFAVAVTQSTDCLAMVIPSNLKTSLESRTHLKCQYSKKFLKCLIQGHHLSWVYLKKCLLF